MEKFAMIRNYAYGWDWTEWDENENIILYDTEEEAQNELASYIEEENNHFEMGHTPHPYQNDCAIAPVHIHNGVIQSRFVRGMSLVRE
jgi:hypothetical protein